jgi:GNAT superfamily N-acetyltransferase
MSDDLIIRFDKDFDLGVWLRFYHVCSWNRDSTVDDLAVIREHAYLVGTAWMGEAMVGTLIVLSDGRNYATIDDVVVRPDYRLQGIGTALMRAALDRLTHINAGVIHLNAIPGVAPFYERLGFVAEVGSTPMYLRREPEA